MKLLVTGGAGFIGSNFIQYTLAQRPGWHIVNLDALTYAGNLANFDNLPLSHRQRHHFIKGDIKDKTLLTQIFSDYNFEAIINFAAESHVDRSILGPEAFVETNVLGTFRILETAKCFWEKNQKPNTFRFLHVSTDEVYGSLGKEGYFKETSPYDPSSPYSASKGASDHFVSAYFRTYGLPTIITNCSNNYGPYQFPEKLIPLMIINSIEQKPLPVYGDGKNVRDWLYVHDHCEALLTVIERGIPGETYNIGGNSEKENIEIISQLCDLLDERLNRKKENSSFQLIRFVPDRPGHDRRYAIDASKIKKELGWQPQHSFEKALTKTVDWYLQHLDWVNKVKSGEYRQWVKLNYQNRDQRWG